PAGSAEGLDEGRIGRAGRGRVGGAGLVRVRCVQVHVEYPAGDRGSGAGRTADRGIGLAVSGGSGAGAERTVRRALSDARQSVGPVMSDLQAGWMRFNDPAAQLVRRKRRTSRAFTLWLVLTLLSVLFTITGYFGVLGGTAGVHSALEGNLGLLIFGTFATRACLKLHTLHRTQLSHTSRQPLPPTGSAAREPMRRLAECESSLSELLGSMPADSTTPQSTADDAAATLRNLSDRIRAIERARD